MTSRTANFNCIAVEVTEIVKPMAAGIIDGDDELKKHDVPNNSRYRFAAIKQKQKNISQVYNEKFQSRYVCLLLNLITVPQSK